MTGRRARPGSSGPSRLEVVLFSGGRGSEVLSIKLITDPRIDATIVVNGYDDGKSTGEVRRFLGDCLGPSDFRKNAARMARQLGTASGALIDLVELRLPEPISGEYGRRCLGIVTGCASPQPTDVFQHELEKLSQALGDDARAALRSRFDAFLSDGERSGREFVFSDCAIGNIVLGGCFVACGRDFNAGLADYCALLSVPARLIENVTCGEPAYLVATDTRGRLLASEAEIVDARLANRIDDIFLIDRRVEDEERARLGTASRTDVLAFLDDHAMEVTPNERVLETIRRADLIVYSPGTQHSSLFPSYITPGVGKAIAGNLHAIKLLITNLEEDADIQGSSAVGIIERAVYYLREKNRRSTPQSALVTHYLINDPQRMAARGTYIPLGSLDRLLDPRLVRIGDYEGETAGRHDASKVLQPFIDQLLPSPEPPRVAVLLMESESANKLGQTMTERVRAGIDALPFRFDVYYRCSETFDADFRDALPFEIHNLAAVDVAATGRFVDVLRDTPFDYVALFESSGMYKGDDLVNLLELIAQGRFDAIWGSRRLSVTDIHMAYGLLHRNTPIKGAISYLGSHALSLSFLCLYGRYLSDTLSGIKVVAADYLRQTTLDPEEPGVNFKILSVLLRDRAEIFEAPVHYFPISPEKVRRTTLADGLRALGTTLAYRFRPVPYRSRVRSTMRRPHFDSFSNRDLQVFAAPDREAEGS